MVAVLAGGGAAAMLLMARQGSGQDRAGQFFGAGALLLVALLAAGMALLARLAQPGDARGLTLWRLGLRGAARRPGRTLAVAAMLACGCFLVSAVSAFRQDSQAVGGHVAGDMGFRLYGELTLPLVHDLNTAAGREQMGVSEAALAGARMVGLRVHDGDDASCLNLGRAQHPRLLGAEPGDFTGAAGKALAVLAGQGSDGRSSGGEPSHRPYRLDDGAIPAIGDENTVTWGLGKAVGDTINDTDEAGRPVKLRIVAVMPASVLQGSLLISAANFMDLFPSAGGWRLLLVDCPPERVGVVRDELTAGLEKLGVQFTPAADRLAMFSRVENTYLSIFQVLGGLGLILGSAGLGVVVLRNIMERRGELAALRAMGFARHRLGRMLLIEHAWVFLAGLVCGVLAAAVAVGPQLAATTGHPPYGLLLALLGAIVVSGFVWIGLAVLWALRGSLLGALRTE
jgi:hypothetical protein